MFGPDVRKHFVKGTTTNWDAEPWAMGSLSCTKPGYTDARQTYENMATKVFAAAPRHPFWMRSVRT